MSAAEAGGESPILAPSRSSGCGSGDYGQVSTLQSSRAPLPARQKRDETIKLIMTDYTQSSWNRKGPRVRGARRSTIRGHGGGGGGGKLFTLALDETLPYYTWKEVIRRKNQDTPQGFIQGGGLSPLSKPPPPPPPFKSAKYYKKVVLKHKQQQSDSCCSKRVCTCSKTPRIIPTVYMPMHPDGWVT